MLEPLPLSGRGSIEPAGQPDDTDESSVRTRRFFRGRQSCHETRGSASVVDTLKAEGSAGWGDGATGGLVSMGGQNGGGNERGEMPERSFWECRL